MTVSVNLNDAKEFIESEKFVQFLLNNTIDVSIPVFILQTLEDAIKQATKEG